MYVCESVWHCGTYRAVVCNRSLGHRRLFRDPCRAGNSGGQHEPPELADGKEQCWETLHRPYRNLCRYCGACTWIQVHTAFLSDIL